MQGSLWSKIDLVLLAEASENRERVFVVDSGSRRTASGCSWSIPVLGEPQKARLQSISVLREPGKAAGGRFQFSENRERPLAVDFRFSENFGNVQID
jgi:hypothetical protein